MPGLLDVDDLALCDDLEEDLRAMLGCFVEVNKNETLKGVWKLMQKRAR